MSDQSPSLGLQIIMQIQERTKFTILQHDCQIVTVRYSLNGISWWLWWQSMQWRHPLKCSIRGNPKVPIGTKDKHPARVIGPDKAEHGESGYPSTRGKVFVAEAFPLTKQTHKPAFLINLCLNNNMMDQGTSKKTAPHDAYTEHSTPKRAKIQGAVELLEAKGLIWENQHAKFPDHPPPLKHDIYQFFGIPD